MMKLAMEEKDRLRTILFDFDGTVYDTVEGITKSIQFALSRHGIMEETDNLRCFAGPPLLYKFMEVYGVGRKEAKQLVADFRERYVPVGIYESQPFPGIKSLLNSLRSMGFRLGIATSKPQEMAEFLLERSDLSECFDIIVGSDITVNNEEKWHIVLRAMNRLSADEKTTVLVGDTKYDVAGAARCGIPCIGVGWGYAAPGELEAAGAEKVVGSMNELIEYITER